jgi:hypothetical protein
MDEDKKAKLKEYYEILNTDDLAFMCKYGNPSSDLKSVLESILHGRINKSNTKEFKARTWKLTILTIAIALLLIALVSASIVLAIHGLNDVKGDPICKGLFPYSIIYFGLAFCSALAWALYLYTYLRRRTHLEEIDFAIFEKYLSDNTPETIKEHFSTHNPFSFHSLAESHKEWAQLWFTCSLVIFLGGLTYASFNVGTHLCPEILSNDPKLNPILLPKEWPQAWITLAPNAFVYALFIVIWQWSSRHYRSHWHNFVMNAYRHRALYRFENLRDQIKTSFFQDKKSPSAESPLKYVSKDHAADTILELYRLSGILLLIPGESAYLDKKGGDDITDKIIKYEEITKPLFRKD